MKPTLEEILAQIGEVLIKQIEMEREMRWLAEVPIPPIPKPHGYVRKIG